MIVPVRRWASWVWFGLPRTEKAPRSANVERVKETPGFFQSFETLMVANADLWVRAAND